jgi:thiol-disulfide isomerase/thioredoxin
MTTPPRRPTMILPALVAAVAVFLSACSSAGSTTQAGDFNFASPGGKTAIFYDPPESRNTIGTVSGPDLMTEAPISLSDFDDKIVVINVWGSWCAPCRTETPELELIYNEYRSRGVQLLGIDVRDDMQAARDFKTDRNVSYPSIFDPEMRTLIALGRNYPTSVVPTTMVLDRRHRVAAVYLMALLADDLRPLLDRLLQET